MTSKRMAAWLVLFLLCVGSPAAASDQVIFVVRHAERADGGAPSGGMTAANDPPLSPAGTERAKRLAAHLASAEVKSIFTTEFARTRLTAAPLAEAIQVKPSAISSKDVATLIQQAGAAAGNVLIVGHSNTVPDVLKQLGVKTPIAIAENDYDNLFVVVRPATGEPTLIRLRY